REVAELCVVADALPLAAEQVPPPPELKDRVMAVVRAEAEAAHAAAAQEGEAAESAAAPEAEAARPAAAPEADRRVRKPAREPWWRRMTLRLAPLPAVAAAVLLLAIGAGGALLLSRSSTSDVPAQV